MICTDPQKGHGTYIFKFSRPFFKNPDFFKNIPTSHYRLCEGYVRVKIRLGLGNVKFSDITHTIFLTLIFTT